MTARKPTPSRILVFHSAEQVLDRGFGDDTLELRAVVVDQTDVVDDNIVHHPLATDVVQAVIDGSLIAVAADDLGFDARLLALPNFTHEVNFLVAGGAYAFTIKYQKPLSEGGDEFTLFPLIH
jgi:hypothetical protein